MEPEPVSGEIRKICSLDEAAFAARRKELLAGFIEHIVSKEALPDGIAFHFARSPAQRTELEDFVAFERECCSGIDFEILDRGETLRLEVRGFAAGSDLHDALLSGGSRAVRDEPAVAQPSRWSHGLKAAGVGSFAGLLVCCVVPLAIAATLGAAVAAPFATLDQPAVIAASSLGFAFIWWRRSRPARPEPSSGCDC